MSDGDAEATDSVTEQASEADPLETARRQACGRRWASLMARTCEFDVLARPRCGGRLRLIALIEEAAVVDQILMPVGVPTQIPAPRPAGAPPLRAENPD